MKHAKLIARLLALSLVGTLCLCSCDLLNPENPDDTRDTAAEEESTDTDTATEGGASNAPATTDTEKEPPKAPVVTGRPTKQTEGEAHPDDVPSAPGWWEPDDEPEWWETDDEPEWTELEGSHPEWAVPEWWGPEGSEPEGSEPEWTEPEATEPEATEPEWTEPEWTEPEWTEPEWTEPEWTEPEYTEPEEDVIELDPDTRLYFELENDNTYRVIHYDTENPPSEIRIPETYHGLPVTSISGGAFSGFSSATSLFISKNIQFIGPYAFDYCETLESITVDPQNPVFHSEGNCLIETEPGRLIRGCKNSVIPTDGSVTVIGDSAFYGCYTLTSISIPDCITAIEAYAFGYTAIESITIPENVVKIGYSAFVSCDSLTAATFIRTSGWWYFAGSDVGDFIIPEEKLSDPEAAAELLTTDLIEYTWYYGV